MQIKKTRLKQIIAEEIARFDTLPEEDKVEEALFEKTGRQPKTIEEAITQVLKKELREGMK